jgi:magnesium-transporting ATPase (P-type)
MDVTEQTEEQRAEAEVLPGSEATLRTEAEVPHGLTELPQALPPPPPPPPINRAWLRIAYALEFWIALIAIFIVWSQVGGQPHLDLMAWYIKLILAVALAFCAVKMTSAMVERPRAWNTGSIMWLLAVLVLSVLMFYVTYWYHLHEQDDQGTDENSGTTVSNRMFEQNFLRVVITSGRENR